MASRTLSEPRLSMACWGVGAMARSGFQAAQRIVFRRESPRKLKVPPKSMPAIVLPLELSESLSSQLIWFLGASSGPP